jgi:hypothetical protein
LYAAGIAGDRAFVCFLIIVPVYAFLKQDYSPKPISIKSDRMH